MQQYKELLSRILTKGTLKPAARENMPGTISLFGYQFRHDLSEGFPLLTTKKMYMKGVIAELIWFLRGDTNIKYLVDNGVNIWNEDAYQYYRKILKKFTDDCPTDILIEDIEKSCLREFTFEEFIHAIKNNPKGTFSEGGYNLGDCGKQYGWLWRKWEQIPSEFGSSHRYPSIDQITELIQGLKNSPQGRRHIITAWNPATLGDMALNACHCLVQFNCRPLTLEQRRDYFYNIFKGTVLQGDDQLDYYNIPEYYLDCQLYQRSADVFLGVPFNIASYALLIELISKIVGMIPGEFIHTFGDVHIYENHMDAVDEQMSRDPFPLPKLLMSDSLHYHIDELNREGSTTTLDSIFKRMEITDFTLEGYQSHDKITAKLSTGLQ